MIPLQLGLPERVAVLHQVVVVVRDEILLHLGLSVCGSTNGIPICLGGVGELLFSLCCLGLMFASDRRQEIQIGVGLNLCLTQVVGILQKLTHHGTSFHLVFIGVRLLSDFHYQIIYIN